MSSGFHPEAPWMFAQTYEHLLLVHWPVPVDELRPRLPEGVVPATFEGSAWLGHDVYVGTNSRLRGLPPPPIDLARPVVTLRTIVDVGGSRGIFLFSLDARSELLALVESAWLGVPSHAADIQVAATSQPLTVRSRRNAGGVIFRASYRPLAPGAPLQEGSRDWFLLGGNRMFTSSTSGGLQVLEVEHGPWRLAPAEVTFERNDLPAAAGLPGPSGTLVATYQRSQDAYAALPRSF